MKKAIFILGILVALLNTCTAGKVIRYSFYVENHGDYYFRNSCYGIDDKPFHRLLITDCGGYKNLAKSITSFGLIKSNEEVTNTYKQAVSMYLNQKYSACEISNFDDLGGNIFEAFYSCEES